MNFPECLFGETILGSWQCGPRRWSVSTSRFLGRAVGTGERVVERSEWIVSVSRSGRVRVVEVRS